MNICELKNIERCNGCQLCKRIELEYIPRNEELDEDENPFGEIYEDLVIESITYKLMDIFKADEEEIEGFLSNKYIHSKFEDHVPLKLSDGKIEISIYFQIEEVANEYDELVDAHYMGFIKMKCIKTQWTDIAIIGSEELIEFIRTLQYNDYKWLI